MDMTTTTVKAAASTAGAAARAGGGATSAAATTTSVGMATRGPGTSARSAGEHARALRPSGGRILPALLGAPGARPRRTLAAPLPEWDQGTTGRSRPDPRVLVVS